MPTEALNLCGVFEHYNERDIIMIKSAELAMESKAGLRFLVIEDMAELAVALVECLRALDFEAEVASTGEAALRMLSSRSFDVALVDIDLPDTTGFEVVAIASAAGWLGHTAIVFCTGSPSEEHQQRAARFPGSRFLLKPFAFQGLLKYVEEIRADQFSHEPRGIGQPSAPGGVRTP